TASGRWRNSTPATSLTDLDSSRQLDKSRVDQASVDLSAPCLSTRRRAGSASAAATTSGTWPRRLRPWPIVGSPPPKPDGAEHDGSPGLRAIPRRPRRGPLGPGGDGDGEGQTPARRADDDGGRGAGLPGRAAAEARVLPGGDDAWGRGASGHRRDLPPGRLA